MIGTIGGYIGLFLGYSALQIPLAIIFVIEKIRLCSSKMKVKISFEDDKLTFEQGKNNLSSDVHAVEVQEFPSKKDTQESNYLVAQEYSIQEIQKLADMKIE